jgi:hypothetical protein
MLDFDEVGRRMVMRQQMAPTGIVMAHTSIVALSWGSCST